MNEKFKKFNANIGKLVVKKKDEPHKQNTPKVFGVPFDRTSNTIPVIIKRVVEYFDVKGVEIEGLFRISGGFSDVTKLKGEFDEGKNPVLLSIDDPHVCAGLLKQYLRELPEPLLTFELYDCFLASASVPEEALADTIKKVLTMLPLSHRIILKYLISFLSRVSQASHINKMSPANIAIVFAPNLLKPQSDDIATQITDTPYSNKLMELFVQQYSVIFKDEPDEPLPSLKNSINNNSNNFDPLRNSREDTNSPIRNSNNTYLNNDEIAVTNAEINQLSNFTSKPLPKPPNKPSPLNDSSNNNNNNNNNLSLNLNNNVLVNSGNTLTSSTDKPKTPRRAAPARPQLTNSNNEFSQAPSIPPRPGTPPTNTPPIPPRSRSNTVQESRPVSPQLPAFREL